MYSTIEHVHTDIFWNIKNNCIICENITLNFKAALYIRDANINFSVKNNTYNPTCTVTYTVIQIFNESKLIPSNVHLLQEKKDRKIKIYL